ncbi:MAG TPA: WXG100 family type VII secretion target [Bradyrhizobium sp.]|uniref:WXG100 family type VII secretion target n=1 Tax=Bradyrhizobium sp. TaxID=376 RepID=UPI002CA4CBD4|nr:WXG100 family type VII secretion target [Bradyrhizobium sp.]HTB02444.1 WXG100 family type VII secretion target [Bradyrhizobium sp.]
MTQIIVDPAELRRFASVLQREVSTLREQQRALEANRRELSQVWKDSRYSTFEQSYLPTLEALNQFCRASESYASYLRRKADKVDSYLGRR